MLVKRDRFRYYFPSTCADSSSHFCSHILKSFLCSFWSKIRELIKAALNGARLCGSEIIQFPKHLHIGNFLKSIGTSHRLVDNLTELCACLCLQILIGNFFENIVYRGTDADLLPLLSSCVKNGIQFLASGIASFSYEFVALKRIHL